MTMTIEQLYLQRQKEKEESLRDLKEIKVLELSNKIRGIFTNPFVISKIETNLIEYGSVTLKYGPCTCESGGCVDTKGFKDRIQDLIEEWGAKGVCIDFGIDQTFYLKTVPHNRAFPKSTINVREIRSCI